MQKAPTHGQADVVKPEDPVLVHKREGVQVSSAALQVVALSGSLETAGTSGKAVAEVVDHALTTADVVAAPDVSVQPLASQEEAKAPSQQTWTDASPETLRDGDPVDAKVVQAALLATSVPTPTALDQVPPSLVATLPSEGPQAIQTLSAQRESLVAPSPLVTQPKPIPALSNEETKTEADYDVVTLPNKGPARLLIGLLRSSPVVGWVVILLAVVGVLSLMFQIIRWFL